MNLSSQIAIRRYRRADEGTAVRMLSFLPTLYPNGMLWLQKRLDDVVDGKAQCRLASFLSAPAGIAIKTPQSPGTIKLSTFWVSESFRRQGIARSLLTNSIMRWRSHDVRMVYMTAHLGAASLLSPLFKQFGFCTEPPELNRYGTGRDEVVFRWVPNHESQKV
jgi:hypothetical protein